MSIHFPFMQVLHSLHIHSYVKPLTIATAASLFTLAGCGGGSSNESTEQPDDANNQTTVSEETKKQQQALKSIGENAVLPTYQSAKSAATDLASKIAGYCNALETSDASQSTALNDAQNQWRKTMSAWQKAEAFQFGPIVDDDNNSIRHRIYSWPSVSSCFIDGGVVAYELDPSNFDIDNQSPRRIGLDGLEYLLFNTNLNHACSTDNSVGNWNERPEAERLLARCRYAEVLTQDINQQLTTLTNEWTKENGYLSELDSAGAGSTRYSTVNAALKEISDALFYLDTEVKDLKIAGPTGISALCSYSSCPEQVESFYAEHSIENIHANLAGIKLILESELSVFFEQVNQSSILTNMIANINTAQANLESFSGSLKASVQELNTNNCINTTSTNRVEPACAIHADIKAVTDQLKVDFVTALSLSVPSTAEGDND